VPVKTRSKCGMSSRLTSHEHQLSLEEQNLLRDAVQNWYNQALFTDEDVAQVKGIFRKVFDLPPDTILAGSTLPDAIVLQSSANRQIFYALVQSEDDAGAWEGMELESDGQITFTNSIPFRLVLHLLADSTGGLTFRMTTKDS
jgi:hypothetical protein